MAKKRKSAGKKAKAKVKPNQVINTEKTVEKKKFPLLPLIAVIAVLSVSLLAFNYMSKSKKAPAQDNSLTVNVINTPDTAAAATATPAVKPKTPAIPAKYAHLFKESATKEEIPKIHIEEATVLFNSGKALFVDARGVGEYNQSHVKGAVSIPVGTPPEKIKEMEAQLKGKVLVSYCHGAGCHLADKTANTLFDAGYKKVIIFFGGWPEWTQANMPVEAWQPPAERAHLFAETASAETIQEIKLEDAKYLYDLGVANFIDIDDVNTFSNIRIERSHSMPYDKLDEMIPGFISFIKEKPAVVYCQSDDSKAVKAAGKMYAAGARKLFVLKGAINKWEAAGFPMFKNPR